MIEQLGVTISEIKRFDVIICIIELWILFKQLRIFLM
jgi:hypothetical protein